MHLDSLREQQRRARRASRRRWARRRRLAGLVVLTGMAAAGLAYGVAAGLGDGGRQIAAGMDEPAAANAKPRPRPAPATPAAKPPSRLGSGRTVTLAFGGDVHFESPIRERLAVSPASILAPMAPVLRRADIAMVNLETAVTGRGTPAAKAFVFRAPASALRALKAGGVDVVTVANNHGMDFGATGLRDTLAAGRRAGMAVVGAGRGSDRAYAAHRVTVKGQRIAIIGATQVLDDHLVSAWTASHDELGLASAKDEPRLARAVREARRSADTVVVYLHWGLELSGCPTADQRSLARALVRAGADVVVGSHAHVLLGTGRLGKALVSYGLGNFVFYAFRESTAQSGVLEVRVTGRRIDGYRWIPARISGGIPRPLSGASADRARRSWSAARACTDLRR